MELVWENGEIQVRGPSCRWKSDTVELANKREKRGKLESIQNFPRAIADSDHDLKYTAPADDDDSRIVPLCESESENENECPEYEHAHLKPADQLRASRRQAACVSHKTPTPPHSHFSRVAKTFPKPKPNTTSTCTASTGSGNFNPVPSSSACSSMESSNSPSHAHYPFNRTCEETQHSACPSTVCAKFHSHLFF